MESTILFPAVLFLVGLFFFALNQSQKTLNWCKQQRSLLESLRSAGDSWELPQDQPQNQHVQSEAVAKAFFTTWELPQNQLTPLRDRQEFLKRAIDTPLMEGDIGTFLLRRLEVPLQQVSSLMSNILVSLAIVCTIVGLIMTVSGLADALAHNEATDFAQLIKQIQAPLRHLPAFFIPTAVGLFLGVLLSGRQGQIDDEIERTWQDLDRFTESEILARILKEKAKAEPSNQLKEAVEELQPIARGMQTSFEKVAEVLKALENLDQSRWVAKVEEAMVSFKECVRSSEQALREASGELKEGLKALPLASQQFAETSRQVTAVSTRLAEGGQALEKATRQTLDSLSQLLVDQKAVLEAQSDLADLRQGISALATSLNSLNGNLGEWEKRQQQEFSRLTSIVEDLQKTVSPMTDHWKLTAEQIQEHARVVQTALSETTDRMGQVNRELVQILETQKATFTDVGEKVAESLRTGHETFLVSIEDRLDQGEGLYTRLEGLRNALQAQSEGLKPLQESLEGMLDSLAPHRLSLEQASLATDGMREALVNLAETYAEMARRPPGGYGRLEDMAQALASLSQDVNTISTSLTTPLWARLFRRKPVGAAVPDSNSGGSR
ncbi:MAG: hypothetical protein GX934_11865 [Burkholderiales bacterium]|nr:hypothetical protein [Burkholderiales bacterium]